MANVHLRAGRWIVRLGGGLLLASASLGQPISGLCDAPAVSCQELPLDGEPVVREFFTNFHQFKHFDDFAVTQDGWLHEVCWQAEINFSSLDGCSEPGDNPADPDCGCNPQFDPNCDSALRDGVCSQFPSSQPHDANQFDLWQLTIWSDLMGLPDQIVAGPFRGDFGDPGAVDAITGVPIAANLLVEQAAATLGFQWSATFEPGQSVFVQAGECYWVEFFLVFNAGGCLTTPFGSYDSRPDSLGGAVGVGIRRSIVWDTSADPNPELPRDLYRFDFPMCLSVTDSSVAGQGNAVGLLPTSLSPACGPRTVVAGDRIEDRVVLAAPQTVVEFDNSWASFDETIPPGDCSFFQLGDVWFEFTTTVPDSADPSVASVLLQRTALDPFDFFQSQDMSMQIFRFVDPQNIPGVVTAGDLQEMRCTTDLSICLFNLPLGETFLVRLYSGHPESQGAHRFEFQSPCPGRENDFCSGAIEIPHDPQGSGYGVPGGAIVFGDTTNATVDIGSPGGCDEPAEPAFDLPAFQLPIGHTGPGLWYRFTGMGNLVRVSTDLPETNFDTTIGVYCSDDPSDPCTSLGCVAANDDINSPLSQLRSALEFCAEPGRDYFVLVHGAGSSAGGFGLLVEELRDEFDQPIACTPTADCFFECVFEIPPGAIDELTDFGALSEACDESNLDGNNNGCDGPPNAEGNWQGLFPKIQVGEAITGTLWRGAEFRDVDNLLFEGLPDDGLPAILDYSWGAEGPIRIDHQMDLGSNLFLCPARGFSRSFSTYCGSGGQRRIMVSSVLVIDNNGVAWGDPGFIGSMNFRFTSRVSASHGGLPCGASNRYWFRIDEVIPWDQCEPVPDPLGEATRDSPSDPLMGDVVFGDWDDEAIQPTFNGLCGAGCLNDFNQGDPDVCNGEGSWPDVYAGEPCDQFYSFSSPETCTIGGRGVYGCQVSSNTEGDFLLLRPGIPMVGQVVSNRVWNLETDIDWYMFEIAQRSIVHISIDSGAPMSAQILENRCGSGVVDQQLFAVGATTGMCGSRNISTDDLVALDAGKYIVKVEWGDLFSSAGTFNVANGITCDQLSLGKYVVEVSAEIAPQCMGDADGSGAIDFADVNSVLGNWLNDYNPSPARGSATPTVTVWSTSVTSTACWATGWRCVRRRVKTEGTKARRHEGTEGRRDSGTAGHAVTGPDPNNCSNSLISLDLACDSR